MLSDTCYKCHGPDAKARKSDLRLDDRLAAMKSGVLTEGEMLRRLTTNNPDDLMPPPDSGRSLTAAEKDSIRRWIEQGAKWQQHCEAVALPASSLARCHRCLAGAAER